MCVCLSVRVSCSLVLEKKGGLCSSRALSPSTLPHTQPLVACQRVKYTLKGLKFSVVRAGKVTLTTQALQPELDP